MVDGYRLFVALSTGTPYSLLPVSSSLLPSLSRTSFDFLGGWKLRGNLGVCKTAGKGFKL
jgi:hypothetical protein